MGTFLDWEMEIGFTQRPQRKYAATAKIWNHKSQQKNTKVSLLGSASGEAEQREVKILLKI
jgi:hypothetical protein